MENELKNYGLRQLRLLARQKCVVNYAKYNFVDMINILAPIVNKHDFPILNKSRFNTKKKN